nr:mitochondrial inner membrane translocase subunit TIM17/TIM22/TIM23/peroxisomal protein PMP24 [Tanacetum cinerariifolium]
SLTNSLDTRDCVKIRITLPSGHPSCPYSCINNTYNLFLESDTQHFGFDGVLLGGVPGIVHYSIEIAIVGTEIDYDALKPRPVFKNMYESVAYSNEKKDSFFKWPEWLPIQMAYSDLGIWKNTPQCYTKPLDSLKNWNNCFFWVDECVFPTAVEWQTNASKDGMPASEMDLFNLIRAPNPTKVKTGSRPRAAHELPLLTLTAPRVIDMDEPAATTDSSGVPSTIERSPLDFAHEAEASGRETAAPEMPPPEEVPITTAPGTDQAVETVAVEPPAVRESRKRGHEGIDANAPPKSLRRDHADFRPSGSSRGGKSLAAMQLCLASNVFVSEGVPADVSDPDPLAFADAPSPHPANVWSHRRIYYRRRMRCYVTWIKVCSEDGLRDNENQEFLHSRYVVSAGRLRSHSCCWVSAGKYSFCSAATVVVVVVTEWMMMRVQWWWDDGDDGDESSCGDGGSREVEVRWGRVVMTMVLWREGSVVVTWLGWPEGWQEFMRGGRR